MTDKNPSLKFYPTLIIKDLLHKNAAALIIFNISDNKLCIPKDIIIGTLKVTSNDSYSIDEITIGAIDNVFKADIETNGR